jgi:hypothetical protein
LELHLAEAETDLLVAPYFHCYRYGCLMDSIDAEYVLEKNLNAPMRGVHRTRTLASRMSNNSLVELPAQYSSQQMDDLQMNLQTRR